jgi:hypothetical protein
MTSAEIYQWMKDPSLLTKSSLFELRQMVDDFPYFHAVRMLYLKNLALFDDVRLDKELKRMAVYIPDRVQLFMLIKGVENSRFKREEYKPVADNDRSDDTIRLIDKILSAEVSPAPPPVSALDYVGWLETNVDDLPLKDGGESRMKGQDLIDRFIENESKPRRARLVPVDTGTDEESEDEKKNRTDTFEKASLDDSYFTETLAHVYISQQRYDKALEIIRVLSLKYPEKNVYFADQIRYLEKIINIKK